MIIKLGTRIIQIWIFFLMTIFIHFWIQNIPLLAHDLSVKLGHAFVAMPWLDK